MSEAWRNPMRALDLVPARRRSPAGFTLIELLVVVSIIALLLAILLPSLSAARHQSMKTKCLANLHAIHLAMVCYAHDHGGFLPAFDSYGGWGFRVALGRKVDSVYPETYGVGSVLHYGYGPGEAMGNGLRRLAGGRPVYLPGDGPVWVCPSNPGPTDVADKWRSWGNTYYYRTMTEDDNVSATDKAFQEKEKKFYNLDYLSKRAITAALQPICWDNYQYKPAPSGMGRPRNRNGYIVGDPFKRAPHRASSVKKDAGNFWCANYADGHCQMNVFNHR